MLLCDAATASEGKLYVLGGGWSQVLMPDEPFSMGLAIQVAVPWDQTNVPHTLLAKLITADGEEVEIDGNPVRGGGDFELGRPPGLAPGTQLDAVFALNFPAIALPADAYVWELELDAEVVARAPFRVGPAPRR
jgi:hypothetical protein